MDLERRIIGSRFTLRNAGGTPTLVGHAAVFDRDSELIAGSFIERIAPGAFRESLANGDDVRALINHDASLILARNTSGTLLLREDQYGLYVEINPPKTSYAQDLLESARRGDVSQMSFGFTVPPGGEKWERGQNGRPDIRTLLKVNLFDVSVVTFPAYPDTDVAVRSHSQFVGHTSLPSSSSDVQLRRRRMKLEMLTQDIPEPSEDITLRRHRLRLEALSVGSTVDSNLEEYLDHRERARRVQLNRDAAWDQL